MIIFDLINNIFKCWSRFEFSTSIMLFILSGSKNSSKDVVILKIRTCDGSLTDISLSTSVASERNGVFDFRVTSSSSIYFDS